jgi:hypothetical protein
MRYAAWAFGIVLVAARMAAADQPVVTPDELFGDPTLMNDGTNVRLQNVVVKAKSGILIRVGVDHHEIFVAPMDPSTIDFLAIGAHVDVQGTLRRTPSARQAELTYAMGSGEARRLARTQFFVDAWALSAID